LLHNIAQNRPDNFPSCPPDSLHCSNDVYLREVGIYVMEHSKFIACKFIACVCCHLLQLIQDESGRTYCEAKGKYVLIVHGFVLSNFHVLNAVCSDS